MFNALTVGVMNTVRKLDWVGEKTGNKTKQQHPTKNGWMAWVNLSSTDSSSLVLAETGFKGVQPTAFISCRHPLSSEGLESLLGLSCSDLVLCCPLVSSSEIT